MSVHDNLFFVSILKRFGSRKRSVLACCDLYTFVQSEEISAQDVHVHCFSNIVSIVSSQDLISSNFRSSPVKSLSSENPAKGTIICQTNSFDDLIHCPPIQVSVRYYGKWELVCFLI